MIIGDGMIASAFRSANLLTDEVCIFASGVSNSNCCEENLFQRESDLLQENLILHSDATAFVYFGTCSVYDPVSNLKPYVQHKLEMEEKVLAHPFGFIARLPQVAGPSPSPYTLLSVLCQSIRLGKTIDVWEYATRNIIDVVDVVRVVALLVSMEYKNCKIINVASPHSHSIMEIIKMAESILNRKARLKIISAGASYQIDIATIEPLFKTLGISFTDKYLADVIARYYL